jgi:hypothetical protein
MAEQDVQDAIKKALKTLASDTTPKSTAGVNTFNEIEANTNLTAQERQRVHEAVVKDYVSNAMKSEGGKTLMRLDSGGTGYVGAYMDKYAEDFNNAMRHSAINETARTQLPPSIRNAKEFGRGVGSSIKGSDGKEISDKDRQKFDDATVDLAGRMIKAGERNMPLLSENARGFLQAALEPTKTGQDPEALNQATASILFLRNASAKVNADANAMKLQKDTLVDGALLSYANTVMTTYYNNVNGDKKGVSKAQDGLAEKLRDKQTLGQTKEVFKNVSDGDLGIAKIKQKVGDPLDYTTTNKNINNRATKMQVGALKGDDFIAQRDKKTALIQAERGVSHQLDRLVALQHRQDRLNTHPHFSDKVKGFFAGGMDKLKAQTTNEINNTRKDIVDFLQKNPKTDIDKIITQNQERLGALKGVSDNLTPKMTDYILNQQKKNMPVEKAATKAYQKNEGKVNKVETRIKEAETVRQSLGLPPKQKQTATDLGINLANTIPSTTNNVANLKPKTNVSMESNVSDVGINQLAGGNFGKVPPQKPTVQKPKPEDGINDLAKGNFTKGQSTNKQDPNKKLVLTVGKELEGQLQSLKQDGPKRRRSLSVGGVS